MGNLQIIYVQNKKNVLQFMYKREFALI